MSLLLGFLFRFDLEAQGVSIKLLIHHLDIDSVSSGYSFELWLDFVIRVRNQSEIKAIGVPCVSRVVTLANENVNLGWSIDGSINLNGTSE
jgi:hypothetical protein